MCCRPSRTSRGSGAPPDRTKRNACRSLFIRSRLYLIEDQAMERRASRIPRRLQSAEPFRIVKLGSIRWKRDGSPGKERRKNRHVQAMRIENGTHAETAILWRQIEPSLNPGRSSQHVAVAGRNQLRLGGRTRSLQDEGGRVWHPARQVHQALRQCRFQARR